MSGIWSNYRGMTASCKTLAGGYYGTYTASVSADGQLTLSVVNTQGKVQALCRNIPVCDNNGGITVSFNTYGVYGKYVASDYDGYTQSFVCSQNFPAF